MGISLATLSQAAHADLRDLSANPRLNQWQSGLRVVANLWADISSTYGGEHNARLFLNQPRPELMDRTPLDYLENGEPEVVHNFIFAIKEMLP
jgi:uncharacterized protein (DUF2384 family)